MTAAQQRNRDINRKIENSDRLFRLFFGLTALLLVIFACLTFVQVLKVNANLQAQIQNNRAYTDEAVKRIQQDNERNHNEQTAFLKCILLLQRDQRTEAQINGCIDAAENGGGASTVPTDSIAPTTSSAVTNPTIMPESTQPPKTPEQPAPEQPVAAAPPPEGVVNVNRTVMSIKVLGLQMLDLVK